MTAQRELRHAHDPVNIGQWALTLKPDFIGRAHGGFFMAVYSYHDELNGPVWGLGFSLTSVDQARAEALNQLAQARFGNEIELLLIDHTS